MRIERKRRQDRQKDRQTEGGTNKHTIMKTYE